MALFFVVATTNKAAAEASIRALVGENLRSVKDDTWFVEFDGTSQDLAVKIGFVSGEAGSGIVIPVTNYAGRASAELWEWVKLRFTKAA